MKQRLYAVLLYLGCAPIAPFFLKEREPPFIQHHYRQALTLQFLLLCAGLIFVAIFVILSFALVYYRSFYEEASFEPRLMSISRKIFLAWLVFWAYGLGSAILGAQPEMPLVAWLARKRRLRQLTVGVFLGLYGAVIVALPFSLHATALTKNDLEPAPVYLLYDDVDRYPRGMFTLAFYRLSLAAHDRFGAGSVVATKLTEESLQAGMASARFIFIASHGKAQGLILEGGWLEPEEVIAWPTNPHLNFVYLAGCDSGAVADLWETAFAPAQVHTYDRLSAVLEHLWWMWSRGPTVIRALPEVPPDQPSEAGG